MKSRWSSVFLLNQHAELDFYNTHSLNQQFTDISLLSDTLYWLTFNSSQIYHSSQTHYPGSHSTVHRYITPLTHYTGSHSTVHRYITPLRHIILAHIQQFTDISLLSDTLYWLTFNSSRIYHSSQTHYTGSHSTVHRYITPLTHIILAHIHQFTVISLLSDTLYWLTFNQSLLYS
jgi:hypothetical protein